MKTVYDIKKKAPPNMEVQFGKFFRSVSEVTAELLDIFTSGKEFPLGTIVELVVLVRDGTIHKKSLVYNNMNFSVFVALLIKESMEIASEYNDEFDAGMDDNAVAASLKILVPKNTINSTKNGFYDDMSIWRGPHIVSKPNDISGVGSVLMSTSRLEVDPFQLNG